MAEDLYVHSDPSLLERVIRNLTSNAIRYTKSGSIRIGATQVGNHVRLEVADTGIGIPESEISHIFDEYYQIQNQHRDRSQGLGLGLAIVQRIVSLLGIALSVDSKMGVGTIFYLDIPVGTASSVAHKQASVDETVRQLACTIALIEDDADILAATERLLSQWGAEVVSGASAREVLAKLQASGKRPDIVLSDFRLPDHETGLDVIAKVREYCGHTIPAMIITGDTGAQELKALSESGITVLHKPVQIDLMHQTLLWMTRTT